MAGIYIHIPFCKQACNYCNFHFSTSLKNKNVLLEAIHKEIILRQAYLEGQEVETIYFGGGTPSLLSAEEIELFCSLIHKYYSVSADIEVTLEANPDDLSSSYLKALRKTPINRFSIGIQSFFDEDLRFMNRAHNAEHAKACIKAAQDHGFHNLTVDLIYGTPTTTHERWLENLTTVFDLQVPHLSCYALTVEPKTALAYQVAKGAVPKLDDNHAAEQFELLLEQINLNGYEQYEISNFCKPPHYARHNSNYWKGKHYLGVGPAAHSFNGHSRQWNIAHNPKYIKALNDNTSYWEEEELSIADQYNEYVMTALRTKWGVDKQMLHQWGETAIELFEEESKIMLNQGWMHKNDTVYTLTSEGKLIADRLISELFWAEDD